ncbi:hypothetical protein [Deinococcus multiflagellatus]|uniref:Uncharacterized protein n=1 Tax=Deinococcus multiflagellatus TaxID=1656887 RepID=A0ABW1ZMI4_9DEIO
MRNQAHAAGQESPFEDSAVGATEGKRIVFPDLAFQVPALWIARGHLIAGVQVA